MTDRTAALWAASGVLVLSPLALATSAPEPVASPMFVDAAFGLQSSQLIDLVVSRTIDEPQTIPVVIDGIPMALALEPHSARSDAYQVLRQELDGTLTPVAPGPVRTFLGEAIGVPGSRVAASINDEGLTAEILLADGERYFIEPLAARFDRAAGTTHVVYRGQDVAPHDGICGAGGLPALPYEAGGGTAMGGTLCTTELACDADYEYFLDYGSVGSVEARINSVINTMNLQYSSEVGITHTITTIIVRDTPSDPYTSTDAETLLNQFRNHWESSQGGVQRDVAQLFTGKEINSSTIGIAWLNAICTSFAYGMVQSDFNGNFASATDLSAHELGHNWGANHCSCTSNTMNAFITSSNTFHPTFTIPEIISFRDSRTCLDCGAGDPTGACCVGTSCSVETAADCSVLGGSYLGDGSSCSGDPCAGPDPTGACCLAGSCLIETEADCSVFGGTYLGDGSDCSGDPCGTPDPTGGCCVGTTCTIETEADCIAAGGSYEGDGTDCGGNPCGGGPTGLPLGTPLVTTGAGVTGTGNLNASDDADLCMDSVGGNRERTDMNVTADGTGSVSSMSVSVEASVNASGVKTNVYLLRVSNNRWTRVASYTQSQTDSVNTINVSNPNRYVNGSGDIRVRVRTEKRRGAHTMCIDHITVTTTP